MNDEPTVLDVIDRIGAWVVLAISTWQAPAEDMDEHPEETAQRVINPLYVVEVKTEEQTETWEDG